PGMGQLPVEQLQQFNPHWFWTAVALHASACVVLGGLYGLLLPLLPNIPGQLPNGAVILPLLWTWGTYTFLGVINPALNRPVVWLWFIATQFVSGLIAPTVVIRSEAVYTPAAGPGVEPEEGGTP